MSGRAIAMTSRKVQCPTCGAPRFEFCVNEDGQPREGRAHSERVEAARNAPNLTPEHIEMLRKLHVDQTRYIEPAMRMSPLKRGLIESLDPPRAPHGHQRTKPPKRRHPLTDAGREAIGVQSDVQVVDGRRGGVPEHATTRAIEPAIPEANGDP